MELKEQRFRQDFRNPAYVFNVRLRHATVAVVTTTMPPSASNLPDRCLRLAFRKLIFSLITMRSNSNIR